MENDIQFFQEVKVKTSALSSHGETFCTRNANALQLRQDAKVSGRAH